MTRMPQEGLKVTLMAPDLERMYFAMATVTDRDEDGTASFEGRERLVTCGGRMRYASHVAAIDRGNVEVCRLWEVCEIGRAHV